MSYAAIAKALYDYDAQDPENELSFKEDDVLYIIEREDAEWWKAKSKDTESAEGQIGLIPANYVEEMQPAKRGQALYAYTSTSPEELSMAEDEQLDIYDTDDEWHLVRLASDPHGPLGFVPVNYTQIIDEHGAVDVIEEVPGEPLPQGAGSYRDPEEMVREQKKKVESRKADGIETWTISELDKKKKKKKGTLGVGNAAVFFASENDKGPVKQYSITSLTSVSQPSSKLLLLTLSDAPEPLQFHCGSKDVAEAIIRKLEYSKEAAGEELDREHAEAGQTSEEEEPAAAPEPKNVRWAPSPGPASPVAAAPTPSGSASGQAATALYDFAAQGDDELTVNEGESLTVVDMENDEWWLVRNARGEEGVVPAQYVEIGGGGDVGGVEDDEDAGAAEAAEAESRAQAEAAAIERAAREKEEREAADHAFALKLEQQEKDKRERRERRRQDEERRRKEDEANERRRAREAARLAPPPEPPKISKRPSAHDVAAAARSLPTTKGRSQPDRPSGEGSGRPKPAADRIRTWNDKTGQFKVEAEFLGLNGNKIRLHKLNGVVIEVPVEKMSPEDIHFIRKSTRKSSRIDEDDVPLATVAARSPAPARSEESRARQEQSTPSRPQQPRKPRFDWFEFFLSAGCDMDDCTRYATNFDRDRMDDSILPDIDAATMRSLGLREGDVIRVKKAISARFAKKTPEQQAQISQDEEYARKLQEHENNPNGGPPPAPPTSLFTGPGGKLANNTRRGRPERKGTVSESVDASSLAAATDKLAQTKVSESSREPTPPLLTQSPPPQAELKPAVTGFDDDAWTLRPSSAKPTTPIPTGGPSSPGAGVPASLLNQINSIQRPASSSVATQNTGGSFDFLSQIPGQQRPPSAPIQQNQTGGSSGGAPASYHAGLGMGNSSSSMSQLLTAQQTGAFNNPNGPRGPVAPIPQNQGLLNPLIPTQTGLSQFVPTRQGLSPSATGMGMQPQQTGFMPQQVQMQQPMYAQQTGYPMQQQQPQFQGMQPNFTGFPQQQQQPQQSVFNTFASVPPPAPQQPQQAGDKFQPSSIFANMKTGNFAKPEEQAPQPSQKYDALRAPGGGGLQPLMTGYNGGMMQSQPTGYGMGMGMGMQPQQTGFMGQPQGPQGGMFQQQQQQQTGYPGQQYPRFQ